MPTNVLPLTPTVRVIFRGFVITRIADGAASAEIAALSTSPCHKPKVRITQIAPDFGTNELGLNLDLTKGFELSVEGVSDAAKGIRVFQKDTDEPFNRLDDENDNRDFRWFVNLPALFGKQELNVAEGLLHPVFKMNNGLFYSQTVSPGEMRIKRTRAGQVSSRRFGRFGLDLGANIYLDQPGARVVLTNGTQPLFEVTKAATADTQTRYVVEFDCNCHIDVEESDFPLVFDVIGEGLTEDERTLTLEGDPLRLRPDLTPEVYCVAGNLSRHG